MKKTFLIVSLAVMVSWSLANTTVVVFSDKGDNSALLSENVEALADPTEDESKHNGQKAGTPQDGYDEVRDIEYTYYPCISGDPNDYCEVDIKEWC